MNVPQQSTWPHYYQAAYTKPSASRITALDFTAPGLAAYKLAKMRSDALSADPEPGTPPEQPQVQIPEWLTGTTGLVILGGVLVLAGALNYQMGKAMAPNKEKASSWGWLGVPLGFVPLGLPIMAIVSNSSKGW